MTWNRAYRIADEQIAYWRRAGISACDAEQALRLDQWHEPTWRSVRKKLAGWAMEHADEWGE